MFTAEQRHYYLPGTGPIGGVGDGVGKELLGEAFAGVRIHGFALCMKEISSMAMSPVYDHPATPSI